MKSKAKIQIFARRELNHCCPIKNRLMHTLETKAQFLLTKDFAVKKPKSRDLESNILQSHNNEVFK